MNFLTYRTLHDMYNNQVYQLINNFFIITNTDITSVY